MRRLADRTLARRPALGLAAISLGFLIITLDATIVNVALGPIGADLGGSLSTAQWIVNGCTVALPRCCSRPGRSPTARRGAWRSAPR